jgi:hypothetical protein
MCIVSIIAVYLVYKYYTFLIIILDTSISTMIVIKIVLLGIVIVLISLTS